MGSPGTDTECQGIETVLDVADRVLPLDRLSISSPHRGAKNPGKEWSAPALP
jgi:hypothetical protein